MITNLEGCPHPVVWTPTTTNIILQHQTNNTTSLQTILSSHANNNNNNNLTLPWQVNSRQIRANHRRVECGPIITKCIWGEEVGVMDICIDLPILTRNKDNKVIL